MSTIVLNSLNYVGTGILNGSAYFWEKSKGIVNAFSPLKAAVNTTQERVNVLWKLAVPVTKGADSACGCVGDVEKTTVVDINVRFDRKATAAERADVYARIKDLVASPEFTGSITSLVLPA